MSPSIHESPLSIPPSSAVRVVSSFERDLRERICVEFPYNQLADLAPYEDGVAGSVLFESPAGVEADALASAEVGRHLAILGSYALARNNHRPGKHFYLANEALLIRNELPALNRDEPLYVCARPDGKSHAEIEMRTPQGELSSTLRCRYQVLSERAFSRFFASNRLPGQGASTGTRSPYATPIEPRRIHTDAGQAVSLLDEVTPQMCLGHFRDYPAMPVAMLMDGLHRLACAHAYEHIAPRFRLITCAVGADQLAFAGESVEFSAELLKREEGLFHYQGFARRRDDPGTIFGRADLAYEVLEGVDH